LGEREATEEGASSELTKLLWSSVEKRLCGRAKGSIAAVFATTWTQKGRHRKHHYHLCLKKLGEIEQRKSKQARGGKDDMPYNKVLRKKNPQKSSREVLGRKKTGNKVFF